MLSVKAYYNFIDILAFTIADPPEKDAKVQPDLKKMQGIKFLLKALQWMKVSSVFIGPFDSSALYYMTTLRRMH